LGDETGTMVVMKTEPHPSDVIETEPDRLREVDGIGPTRASRIATAWAEQKIVREIMVFLHSHGV
jgi:exodeoxyribonuclease V alpha subunit